MSNSTHSYNPAFEPSEEQVDEHLAPEDLDLDEEDEKVKEAEKKVLKEEVWREIILTSNGRDKAFVSAISGLQTPSANRVWPGQKKKQKVIQYSIRVYLLFHASIASNRLLRRPQKIKWELNLVQRLSSTASGLSFTRYLHQFVSRSILY